jgi:hypothetical protein
MRPEQKTKSRTKLYNAISGVKELTGAAGVMATWTIAFAELAAVGDTVTIGTTVFKYVADGSEDSAGESAGTAADPHLISIGGTPSATTAAASLVAQALAETATTGAWGYLYPDDSVGCSNSSGTVTLKFWPGTNPNAAGYISVSQSGTDATVTKTVSGRAAKIVSPEYSYNFIDTTGSTQTKELYVVPDGDNVGDTVNILIKKADSTDTPTIVGHLLDGATANVEALFAAGEDGMTANFMWTGAGWLLVNEGIGTALTFTPAA